MRLCRVILNMELVYIDGKVNIMLEIMFFKEQNDEVVIQYKYGLDGFLGLCDLK